MQRGFGRAGRHASAEFLGRLVCVPALAAAAWAPRIASAQRSLPAIGFLRSTTFGNAGHLVGAFRQGLQEAGVVDDQDATIVFASAEGHSDRLPALAADLVRHPVAVIVGNTPAALAAKAATSAVPIVFTTANDLVWAA